MEYRSGIFAGIQKIIHMSKMRDSKLIAWFTGILGAPVSSGGMDSVGAFNDFNRFCSEAIHSGPVRAEDIKKINEMIFMQLKSTSGLSEYDVRTGTLWKWDGNPMTLVVALGLGAYAAKLLDDRGLLDECTAIQWKALDTISGLDMPEASGWISFCKNKAEILGKRSDIHGILGAFETSINQRKVG